MFAFGDMTACKRRLLPEFLHYPNNECIEDIGVRQWSGPKLSGIFGNGHVDGLFFWSWLPAKKVAPPIFGGLLRGSFLMRRRDQECLWPECLCFVEKSGWAFSAV